MITIKSHGFKFSRPEANIVFDVSYFKNPWREEEIKEKGLLPNQRRKLVLEFMKGQKGVNDLVVMITNVLWTYQCNFPNENIQVAICCSAGEYRSPAIAELIGERLSSLYQTEFIIKHSDNSKI
jgi:RNase adaptor protein for sRNA GlmZ degradation